VRPDIPLSLHPHHVNDAEFARLVAERFVAMVAHKE
jgi:hypothetical protein